VRLLVVEDEEHLAEAVARGLRRRGYAVDVALTGLDAEVKIVSTAYDLVILDWGLPDMSGLDLLQRFRTGRLSTPDGAPPRVLMLTARDAVEDRVEGLDSGADDYLVKPFAFAELEARIRSLLRRDRPGSGSVLAVGDLELDSARFVATRRGRRLDLTVKEFALLEYFMARPGEVLSQETLLEHVWDEMVDPFTNTVRVTISKLRKKLGDPPVIETVPGRGYRLVV
jgi:DNA-binding response OmpR family regulator